MADRPPLVVISGQVQQLAATDAVSGVNAIKSISAGTTRATSGEVVFSNSNGLSFGLNGQTLTGSYTVPSGSPLGISAGTTQATSGTIVFSNSNGISFGMNGQTVTAKMPQASFWDNQHRPYFANAAATNSAGINATFQRLVFHYGISATRLDLLGHLTVAGSRADSYTMSCVLYTMTGSTANSASSGTIGVTFTSGTNTATSAYGGQSGTRWRSVPLGTWNITPGEYMLGFLVSQNGPAGTTGSWTLYGNSSVPLNAAPGDGNYADYFADGVYSAATGAFPSSVHLSAINQTGTLALRQPYLRMVGTF